MKKIINFFAILILGFIGSDRINLLSENFEYFIFTPYILFSIIFILFVLFFYIDQLRFSWLLANPIAFNFLLFYFISIIISILFSMDIYISLKRFVLLLLIILTIILLFSCFDKKSINNILYKGSIIGSLLFYIFNILLTINWFTSYELTSVFVNLVPDQIAHFVPRLGGYSLDVNRGTVVLLFFTYTLYQFLNNNKFLKYIIFLNICFILLSFSRTVYTMLFIMYLWKFYNSDNKNKLRLTKYVLVSISSLIIILSYLQFKDMINFELLINERLNLFDFSRFTSTGIHFKLIFEGIKTAFNDLKILLFGSGIGTSFYLIEGYYWSGSKYGNYHSMYITSLVECGIFNSLTLLIYSFILPLYYGYKNYYLDFIIGLLFFNIFYQLNVEPLFWFALFLFYKTNYMNAKNN